MVSSVNRAAGRKTQPLTVQTGERFSKTKLILNIALTVATVGAFAAATYYAGYAKQQAHSADITAKQAIAANAIAHQNAVQDLRAYVSVGTPQGESVDVLRGASPKPTIRIHFVNTGRTPARHFSVLLWGSAWALAGGGKAQGVDAYPNLTWPTIELRKRFRIVNCPEMNDPRTFAGGVLGPYFFRHCERISPGLGGQDLTLGSQAQRTEDLSYEWTPTSKMFFSTTTYLISDIYGVFEYCDVFGQHHCDSFEYQYKSEERGFVSSTYQFKHVCPVSSPPKDPVPEPTRLMGKKYQWTEMPRCEQPTEKEYSEQ